MVPRVPTSKKAMSHCFSYNRSIRRAKRLSTARATSLSNAPVRSWFISTSSCSSVTACGSSSVLSAVSCCFRIPFSSCSRLSCNSVVTGFSVFAGRFSLVLCAGEKFPSPFMRGLRFLASHPCSTSLAASRFWSCLMPVFSRGKDSLMAI